MQGNCGRRRGRRQQTEWKGHVCAGNTKFVTRTARATAEGARVGNVPLGGVLRPSHGLAVAVSTPAVVMYELATDRRTFQSRIYFYVSALSAAARSQRGQYERVTPALKRPLKVVVVANVWLQRRNSCKVSSLIPDLFFPINT